ncbi:MAG: M20/M25/M40 family metallo-hydrolase [Phycisphaerales bacterium]|nr:M20/M25/M40 family metallo-hydrolase [Phycisphaerales bacterium]
MKNSVRSWLRPGLSIALVAGLCVGLAACGNTSRVDRRGVAIQGVVPAAPSVPYAVIDGKEAPVPKIAGGLGDSATIQRILDEGRYRNQVMDHLRHLTTKIGPRLTGSTAAEEANNWSMAQFRSWGLSSELHRWGDVATRFDRGPSVGKIYAKSEPRRPRRSENATPEAEAEQKPAEPQWRAVRDLQFTTLAWTSGTDGPRRGPVIVLPDSESEYQEIKPKLKGAWVLLKPMSIEGRGGVRGPGQMAGDRFLARKDARKKVAEGTDPSTLPIEDRVAFDGIHGFITAAQDARDRVWTTATPKWRERSVGEIPPDVEITVRQSDYDNMRTRMSEGREFEVEFDLKHTLTPGPIPVYNTIAEIRGTEKPDEVVIVCGHMDSWNGPGSQGTLDNGTGTAVTMEAARILAAAGARPKRTIRFALWTGEEQGLLGARQYVKDLGERAQKISAVLNDDGGTNYQGGLKCTADMVSTLAAATAPINGVFYDTADGKPMRVNIQVVERFPRFASSDHFAFVEVGVPGFFWDEVGRSDYGWGWHTQNDKLELAIPEYLMQSATCAAITAYNLASAPELLPRVPAPKTEKEAESATMSPTNFGVVR